MQKLVDLKAMAYRFLVVPVAGVPAHGGPWRVGENGEEREEVRFDGLPTPESHHGGRIWNRKGRRRLCS